MYEVLFCAGLVHKLSNHITEFGATDAVCCCEGLLLASGYDLDNGIGYVNGIVQCFFIISLSISYTLVHMLFRLSVIGSSYLSDAEKNMYLRIKLISTNFTLVLQNLN